MTAPTTDCACRQHTPAEQSPFGSWMVAWDQLDEVPSKASHLRMQGVAVVPQLQKFQETGTDTQPLPTDNFPTFPQLRSLKSSTESTTFVSLRTVRRP